MTRIPHRLGRRMAQIVGLLGWGLWFGGLTGAIGGSTLGGLIAVPYVLPGVFVGAIYGTFLGTALGLVCGIALALWVFIGRGILRRDPTAIAHRFVVVIAVTVGMVALGVLQIIRNSPNTGAYPGGAWRLLFLAVATIEALVAGWLSARTVARWFMRTEDAPSDATVSLERARPGAQ